MKFRFTGKYTNGHTGVSILRHSFVGREPTLVSEKAAERLARHPEFEAVQDVAVDPVAVIPKRRSRQRKVN